MKENCRWREIITELQTWQWHEQRMPPCYQPSAGQSCCWAHLVPVPAEPSQSSLQCCHRYDGSVKSTRTAITITHALIITLVFTPGITTFHTLYISAVHHHVLHCNLSFKSTLSAHLLPYYLVITTNQQYVCSRKLSLSFFRVDKLLVS